MKTRGVHSDQLAAAIQATEHALNMIALRRARDHPSLAPDPFQKEDSWLNSAQKNR